MTHEPYLTDEEILVLKYRPVIAELAYKAYQAGIRPTDLSGATYEPDMDELKKAYFKMLDFEWDEW